MGLRSYRKSLLFVSGLCLMLSGCLSHKAVSDKAVSDKDRKAALRRPAIMLDAQGHAVLMTQAGVAMTPTHTSSNPAVSSVTVAKKQAKAGAAAVWSAAEEATYTPLETFERQQAEENQHFYVVPSGIAQAGSGEVVLGSGGALDRQKAREPVFQQPSVWKPLLDSPVTAPPLTQALYTALNNWLQHLDKKSYTKVHAGVTLNLLPEDFHPLNADWLALALQLPKGQATHWQLFMYGARDKPLQAPRFWGVVCLDGNGKMQAGQLSRFNEYRPGDDWQWQGWRGPLQTLSTTRRLVLLLPMGYRHSPNMEKAQWVLDTLSPDNQ